VKQLNPSLYPSDCKTVPTEDQSKQTDRATTRNTLACLTFDYPPDGHAWPNDLRHTPNGGLPDGHKMKRIGGTP